MSRALSFSLHDSRTFRERDGGHVANDPFSSASEKHCSLKLRRLRFASAPSSELRLRERSRPAFRDERHAVGALKDTRRSRVMWLLPFALAVLRDSLL